MNLYKRNNHATENKPIRREKQSCSLGNEGVQQICQIHVGPFHRCEVYNIYCKKCNVGGDACKIVHVSTILHYIGETGRRLSDRFSEHLRSVRTMHDVDNPVAQHFNTANHSISDIKVYAISLISCGNDSRKKQEKRVIFKIWTIHPHGLNERFFFIWSSYSFCFCPACTDKSGDFSSFHSLVYVHPPPTYSLRASA